MAFEATKRELGELYTFFRLLADGKVFPGTPDAQRDDRKCWPVALIQREEHDGTRRYYIGEEDVRIVSGTVEKDGTFTASAGTEQQVSAGDLNLILEAAAYAPSGMNFQTWHFTAIQDAAVLTELNEKIKGAFAKSDDPHLQERGHSETYCCYYHAPTLVIVSNEPTRWWAPMDCACALQNIFLAAKSLGIGSCWINQLGQTCDDPDVRAFLTRLGIPENHRVYGCAALGYAPADAPVKEKKLAAGTVTVIR